MFNIFSKVALSLETSSKFRGFYIDFSLNRSKLRSRAERPQNFDDYLKIALLLETSSKFRQFIFSRVRFLGCHFGIGLVQDSLASLFEFLIV